MSSMPDILQKLTVAGDDGDRRNSDINQTNSANETALHAVCIQGNSELVKILLKAGADVRKPDKDGNTCLHQACRNSHIDVVKALVAVDADVNSLNNAGETPITLACQIGNESIVKLLIELDTSSVGPLAYILMYNYKYIFINDLNSFDRLTNDPAKVMFLYFTPANQAALQLQNCLSAMERTLTRLLLCQMDTTLPYCLSQLTMDVTKLFNSFFLRVLRATIFPPRLIKMIVTLVFLKP